MPLRVQRQWRLVWIMVWLSFLSVLLHESLVNASRFAPSIHPSLTKFGDMNWNAPWERKEKKTLIPWQKKRSKRTGRIYRHLAWVTVSCFPTKRLVGELWEPTEKVAVLSLSPFLFSFSNSVVSLSFSQYALVLTRLAEPSRHRMLKIKHL